MKKLLGIVVLGLIFFGVQSSKVVKADLLDDLYELSQDQAKRNKFELAKFFWAKDIIDDYKKHVESN